MPGYMWKQDKNGHTHLEDDILLAYTRGQLGADIVLMVQQHCAKCTVCTQKCAEYTLIGMTLQQSLTYAMPAYPSIVDMLGDALDNPAAASTALRQRSENKRRVRKQSARIPGSKTLRPFPKAGVFPLTISVALVLLTVLLAPTLSNYIGSRASIERSTPNVPTLPVQPTAKTTPVPTMTVNKSTGGTTAVVTPTGTSTSAGTSKPVIWICSSNADLAQSRLRICGKNFKAGDKVIVLEVLPNGSSREDLLTIADAHGSFSSAWTIPNCHSIPIAIFADDTTYISSTSQVMVNISIGGCRYPNVKTWGR
jgi:hypothetical protein